MGTKNQRAVYEWVNISDDLVYEWVRFFKGQVYEWGRFRNTGSPSRITVYIILTPLNHFYIVKLGFTGVYIIFSYFCSNIDCGYSLEPPR